MIKEMSSGWDEEFEVVWLWLWGWRIKQKVIDFKGDAYQSERFVIVKEQEDGLYPVSPIPFRLNYAMQSFT